MKDSTVEYLKELKSWSDSSENIYVKKARDSWIEGCLQRMKLTYADFIKANK